MRDQEILGLQEAYSSIYAQQEEVEQLEEEPKGLPYGPVGKGFKRLPAGPKREKMMKNAKKYTRAAMADADREGEAVGDNRNKMGRINDALTNPRLREETDLFDYILEHLIAEGYADTNKAALAIMANMSEEWKQSIVEGMFDFLPKSKGVITPPDKRNALQKYSDATKPAFSALPKSTTVVPAKQARSREFTNPPS